MNALILFAAAGLFAAGATAGIVSVATLAIRREEKYLTLTGAAPDRLTRAGRWLNGVGVRAPCRPDALPHPLEFKLLEEDRDGVLTPDLARAGDCQVNVGGRQYRAAVHPRPPFDPAGDRVKGRYQNLFSERSWVRASFIRYLTPPGRPAGKGAAGPAPT